MREWRGANVGAEEMVGPVIGNANPLKQNYRCQKCGIEVPPYQSYCDQHQAVADIYDKPSVLDRFMNRLLGRGKPSAH